MGRMGPSPTSRPIRPTRKSHNSLITGASSTNHFQMFTSTAMIQESYSLAADNFTASIFGEAISSGGATASANGFITQVVDLPAQTDLQIGLGTDAVNPVLTFQIKDSSNTTVFNQNLPKGSTSFPNDPTLTFFPLTLQAGEYTFSFPANIPNADFKSTVTIAPAPEPSSVMLIGALCPMLMRWSVRRRI